MIKLYWNVPGLYDRIALKDSLEWIYAETIIQGKGPTAFAKTSSDRSVISIRLKDIANFGFSKIAAIGMKISKRTPDPDLAFLELAIPHPIIQRIVSIDV